MISPQAEQPKMSVTTSNGTYKYKYRMRGGFRAAAFITLCAGFCVYTHFSHDEGFGEVARRRLSETTSRQLIFQDTADPIWTIIFYILGILYMFLALAVVVMNTLYLL